jgi:CRISPR/Cas system type I-B associated protein Csh2 (Cas7 group RAMP superfamily)
MAERYQLTPIEFENFLNDSNKKKFGLIDLTAEIFFKKKCGCLIKMGEYDVIDEDEYKCKIRFCKDHQHYEINITKELTKYILNKYNVHIQHF